MIFFPHLFGGAKFMEAYHKRMRTVEQSLSFLPVDLSRLLLSYTTEWPISLKRGQVIAVPYEKGWQSGVVCALKEEQVLIHINQKSPQWYAKNSLIAPAGFYVCD